MALGTTYKNKILDALLGADHDDDMPATVYLACFTTATTDGGGGTEVVGGGYARIAIPNDDTWWNAAAAGAKSNKLDLLFAVASASWGTVTHVAIVDGAAGTTFIIHGALTTPRTVGVGEQLRFNAGALNLTAA